MSRAEAENAQRCRAGLKMLAPHDWHFDLIVSGLRRYGEDAATLNAVHGIRRERIAPSSLPALSASSTAALPTRRAAPIQGWSATVPFMVTELLGLHACGFCKRLHRRRALLPDEVDGVVAARAVRGRWDRLARIYLPRQAAGSEVIASDGVEVSIE